MAANPYSRRGIVALAGFLMGGGAKALQAQARETLRDQILKSNGIDHKHYGSDGGAPPLTRGGVGIEGLDPIQLAAKAAAFAAGKRSRAHDRLLSNLQSMSRAAKHAYSEAYSRETRGLWRKFDVLIGRRQPEDLFEEYN